MDPGVLSRSSGYAGQEDQRCQLPRMTFHSTQRCGHLLPTVQLSPPEPDTMAGPIHLAVDQGIHLLEQVDTVEQAEPHHLPGRTPDPEYSCSQKHLGQPHCTCHDDLFS